jgi:hypothetical protein
MTYPPPISNDEKKLLRVLKNRTLANPIEWTQLQTVTDLPHSVFLDGFAHLVREDFVDTMRVYQGFIKSLFGVQPETYAFITESGLAYLQKYAHTTAEEDAKEAALNETPIDRRNMIEEAVRIYQDSLSKRPYYTREQVAAAAARLDQDIKDELRKAVSEEEAMWDAYERRFGHRGAAATKEQAAFRDPVIKRTTVRMFRAMDEQLRRLKLPESRKPEAWKTHYNGGKVGLDPAPWQK